MSGKKRFRKGFFGEVDLPVSDSYLEPVSRNRPLTLGAAGAVLMGLVLVAGIWFNAGGLASSGPLSSSHSGLEEDCQVCHVAFQSVADEKCLQCHDRSQVQTGAHTLVNHYGSGAVDSSPVTRSSTDLPCFTCHPEHRGRSASLISSSNQRCLPCHPFQPFASAHPQFSYLAREDQGEPGALFSHTQHLQLLESVGQEGEKACSLCHLEEGASFAPIDFDAQCQQCHETDRSLRMRFHDKDLKVLRRALFDHAAHRIQRDCQDCHAQIMDANAPEGGVSLPGIEVCRECHHPRRASAQCTLCHRFHPPPGALQASTQSK